MAHIYKSVTELVGKTPLIELVNFEKNNNLKATVLGKLEYFNPTGSVKDRAVLGMIEAAEKEGKLKPGDTIVGLDNDNIKDTATLRYKLYKHSIGDTIKITYVRNNKTQTTKITLTGRPETES